MLEESRMDKKSQNRSLQLQSRASAVDCKKNTELTHKPLPRNNKKREGSTSKNEPNRKNIPAQRGRGQLDKRPRTRGASALVVGGAQSTGLEDDEEPEIGSVFVPGSKKQNLNHLLNFMYPSRAAQPDRRVVHPAPRRPNQQRVMRWQSQDLYLRANCQFVVKKDGDYIGNILDPDVPMKWEQIEEVIVRSTGKSECPICLGAPVAGRVGLCGHVYCWACVLHYAAAHEKQPPPCPVCTTPLNVKDMKPTKIVQWEAPGEEVTMRLVRRLRGSTTVEIAPPRGYMPENDIDAILPLDKLNDSPYNKLFHATKKQIRDILERERKEIQDQILAEIDTTEVEYLEQALKMLKEKEDNVNAQVERPRVVERPVEQPPPPLIYEGPEINGNRIDWFDVDNEGAGAAAMIDIEEELQHLDIAESNLNPDAPSFEQNDEQPEEFPLVECAAIVEEQSLDKCNFNEYDKINQAKYFYFYQAEDGQQVFLNSLNVRILNASWSALVAAPEVIKGRVLHRETLSLEDQMRKHMPYTAHLPLYCSFDIVELDLQPPYVSPEALDNFKAELDRRARIRARHEREERRRERAYQRAIEGPPRPDFSSEVLFPPAAASSPPLSEASFSPLEQPMPSTSAMPATSPAPGLSFAKMASTTGTWRVRKTSTPPEPPPAEEDVGAPRTLNLSDAIEAALQAPPAPGSKKKKNKQKVLFATGMTMLDKK